MRKENIYAAMRRGLGGAIFWGWVGDAGAMGSVVKVHNVRGGGNGIAGQLGEWNEGVGGGLAEKWVICSFFEIFMQCGGLCVGGGGIYNKKQGERFPGS